MEDRPQPPDATRILSEIDDDDAESVAKAADALAPLVYDALREIAARYMRGERPHHSLSPTDLVHEAYCRLVDQTVAGFRDRAHFLATAARVMRHILVDYAREQQALKRGGGKLRVTLSNASDEDGSTDLDLLALHDALERLKAKDARASGVVELRFFGGMTIAETATVLGVSHTTVEDDWALARAWLGRELK